MQFFKEAEAGAPFCQGVPYLPGLVPPTALAGCLSGWLLQAPLLARCCLVMCCYPLTVCQ